MRELAVAGTHSTRPQAVGLDNITCKAGDDEDAHAGFAFGHRGLLMCIQGKLHPYPKGEKTMCLLPYNPDD